MRFLAVLCIGLSSLVLVGASRSGEPVDLRSQFVDGQEHRFRVESESTVEQSVSPMGERLSQTTLLTYYLTRTVSLRDSSAPVAHLRFERITLSTQAPNLLGEMQDVDYDTGLWNPETQQADGRTPPADGGFIAAQYATALDPLIGQSIALTLTPDGAIRDVTVPEAMGQSEVLSVEMIRDRFLSLVQICPEPDPVEIGATWQQRSEQDSGLGFDVVSTTHWTLTSAEEDRATIDVRNEFVTGEVREDTGISLRDSSGSGTVIWNTDAGVLERLESRQIVRMAGSPPGLRGGRAELVVRSRLKIERSADQWSIPELPKPPADEESEPSGA